MYPAINHIITIISIIISLTIRQKDARSNFLKFRIRMLGFLVLAAVASVVAGCSTPTMPMSQRVECYRPKVAVLPAAVVDPAVVVQPDVVVPPDVVSNTGADPAEPNVAATGGVTPAARVQVQNSAVAKQDEPEASVRTHNTLRNLKSGDRVIIHLRGIPTLVEINDVIDGWGEVTLPFIGEVKIADKTISEAERQVEKSYIDGGIYKQINVIIVAEDEVYFVQGEVAWQGKYSLSGAVTLWQAISAAGGCTPFANRKKIKIMRGDKILMYNGKDIAKGAVPDPLIFANDIIEVYKRKW
jgi:protein involved in polysaccharide export with SLBB domain